MICSTTKFKGKGASKYCLQQLPQLLQDAGLANPANISAILFKSTPTINYHPYSKFYEYISTYIF